MFCTFMVIRLIFSSATELLKAELPVCRFSLVQSMWYYQQTRRVIITDKGF